MELIEYQIEDFINLLTPMFSIQVMTSRSCISDINQKEETNWCIFLIEVEKSFHSHPSKEWLAFDVVRNMHSM